MKTNIFALLLLPLLWSEFAGASNNAEKNIYKKFSKHTSLDSANLPPCIVKLNRTGSKGIRSYKGGQHFVNIYQLKSGKNLYAFRNEASIGCNGNEPAGNKYYDDSCKLVASFPAGFSIKKSFKPFVAAGYLPEQFAENTQGDYVLYFAGGQATSQENPKKEAEIKDPFISEKWFTLGRQITPLLNFKNGDVIKIHSKTGLWHYRNKKLLNQYKIVPQLAIFTQRIVCARAPCPPIVTKRLVYFLGAANAFIDIHFKSLSISEAKQKDANTPTQPLQTTWIKAYDVTPAGKVL